MGGTCGNQYCDSSNPKMRSPSPEELQQWVDSLNDGFDEVVDSLNTGKVQLIICEACGAWIAERWDEEEKRTVRWPVPLPFRFSLGDRLRVTLQGKRHGMVGVVKRRERSAKLLYPPPVPENYYWLLFKEGQNEEGYGEDHLEPAR